MKIDPGKTDLHDLLLDMAEKAAERYGVSLQRLAFLCGKNPYLFDRIREGKSCRVDTWQDVYKVLASKREFLRREAEILRHNAKWRSHRHMKKEMKNEES